MDGDWTYCGNHFTTYTGVESLCCTPETKLMLHVNYIIKKKKEKNATWRWGYDLVLKWQKRCVYVERKRRDKAIAFPL